jgi:bifunctional oligoribonuclease and PAP phosphatase NrnA
MNKKTVSQISEVIKKSKNILLHLHPGPDGDSLGSALSFYHVLKNLKKNVTIISGDSEPQKSFSVLPGFDQIVNKNFFQVDLENFDLFIILDSASPEQISKIGPVIFPKNLKTIDIDHHILKNKFADINLSIPDAPATCQILAQLYKKLNIKLTPEIAVCLFVGIYTDTGGFKYNKVTSETFSILSDLAKINPDFSKTIFEIENNDSPSRLKLLSIMLGSIKTHFSDHVAVASLSYKELKKNKLTGGMAENLNVANTLKAVTGWDIGVSMIEYQPKKVKVSLRTRDAEKYDLNLIASNTGAGGGHKAAAGATINKPLKYAKKFLLKIISETYPELK